jgi:DNA sulfur modification protein DndD
MIFKELLLENFGPYYGKNIVNLNPQTADDNYHNSPIILIGGMNGGGKTTLMDAIRLALYGKRAECSNRENLSYNDFLVQCVNKNSDLTAETRIELTIEHIINEQWTELKIVRHWQKNIKDGKDNLGIIEGDWPDTNLAENWDEYIEDILPLGISNLFLFDGEQVKELAEQDLPTFAVIQAMKSLLGLELADKLALDLDLLISRKQKELLSDAEQKQLTEIEAELIELEQQKQELIDELSIKESQLKTAQKNYRDASDKFRKEGSKLALEKQNLQDKQELIDKNINQVREELVSLASQYLPLNLINNYLQQIKLQLIKEKKLSQIKNSLELWEIKDQKLLDFLQNINLSKDYFTKIEVFIKEEKENLEQELTDNVIYLSAEETSLPKLNNILDYGLPKQQKLAQEKLAKIENLEREIENLELTLAQTNAPQKYNQLENETKKAEKELIKLKTDLETIKQTLNAVEKKISDNRKKLASYGEKNLENLQVKHIQEVMPKVKETLILFQEKLTLRKLNKLEMEVTNCFRYLLHKSNLITKVAISADNFALTLYDNRGSLVSKNRLSAGEKQLLAIALLWGLARVSGKNLPIAIDTPLGRLDSSHRHNLIERYFPTASHQVILLSTDTEIGIEEVKQLRQQSAIAREYLLNYDSKNNQTTVKTGYFF